MDNCVLVLRGVSRVHVVCYGVRGRVLYDAVVWHRVKTIQESAEPFKILLPHHSGVASSPHQPAAL